MTYRLVVGLCAALVLSACGSRAGDPLLAAVRATVQGIGQGNAAAAPLDQQRAAIRKAIADANLSDPLLMVSLIDRNAVATLGQGGENKGVVTWIDATGVAVALRNGVVLSTRGLGHDMMASNADASVAALRGGRTTYTRQQRYLNGEGQLQTVSLRCSAQRSAARMTETCQAGDLPVTNTYELRSGKVVRSRQWLGRELGYAEIERLQ